MMSFDDDVSLTMEVGQQDENKSKQDAEPSTHQENGDRNAMGHFRDGATELMWTYQNQN